MIKQFFTLFLSLSCFSTAYGTLYLLPTQATETVGVSLGRGLAQGLTENLTGCDEETQKRLIKERYAQEAILQQKVMTLAHEQKIQEMAFQQKLQHEMALQRRTLELEIQEKQAKVKLLNSILSLSLVIVVALVTWDRLKKFIQKMRKKLRKTPRQ